LAYLPLSGHPVLCCARRRCGGGRGRLMVGQRQLGDLLQAVAPLCLQQRAPDRPPDPAGLGRVRGEAGPGRVFGRAGPGWPPARSPARSAAPPGVTVTTAAPAGAPSAPVTVPIRAPRAARWVLVTCPVEMICPAMARARLDGMAKPMP